MGFDFKNLNFYADSDFSFELIQVGPVSMGWSFKQAVSYLWTPEATKENPILEALKK